MAGGGAPIKPGQVLNPEGHNQYTYRADAEKHLAEWCKLYGRELIDRLLDDAKAGDDKMMRIALARILPEVKQISLDVPGADPDALAAELAALASRRRANGHDTEAEPAGTDSSGGGSP